MDAGAVGHMLAHQIDHGVHRLDRVQGRAALVRRGGGVGGRAIEAELARYVGHGVALAGAVDVAGVPVDGDVHVVEQAVADHIDLARSALLGGRAIDAQLALDVVGDHPVLDGDGRLDRGGAEQVVAAAMPGRSAGRLLHRAEGLRQARQGVVFGQHRDDGAIAGPEAGQEGGRFASDPRRDGEARVAQLALQQCGALRLLIAQLGELPDFQRRVIQGRLVSLDGGQDLGAGLGRQFRGGGRQAETGQRRSQGKGAHRDGHHEKLR